MYIFSPDKYSRDFKTIKEIAEYLYSGNKPLTGHISIGKYSDEAIQYKISHNGSMSEFNGAVNGDMIPIDADLNVDRIIKEAKERNIDQSAMFSIALKEAMLTFAPIFNEWDNEGIEYSYGFSGNKGFWIYLSKAYFSNTDKFENNFHLLCKAVIFSLKKKYPTLANDIFTLDIQPYHKIGMLRAPFSKHEKTDKIKYLFVPLKKGDHGSIDKYITIGKDWEKDKHLFPQLLEKIFEEVPESDKKICYLEEQFSYQTQVAVANDYAKPYLMESCIWKIWKEGATSTQGRQPTMMRLASWCAKKRFTADTTMEILRERNNKLAGKGPLPPHELIAMIKKYEKYYYNFCKDEICLEFCPKSKDCPYYEPSRAIQTVHSSRESVELLEEYDKADKSKVVRWDSLFPGLYGDLNPLFGHVGTIGAASGCFKTQTALQLALINNHINWIFWSYEQPEVELKKRLRQILGLEGHKDWKDILEEKTKHIFIIRNGNICVQDRIVMKRQIEMIHNVQISGMLSDYMGIIPLRDPDTGKTLNREEDKIPLTAKIIKDNAATEQVIDIVLCQPKDAYSANGAILLEPEHLKYGAMIQAMSDAQITLCKPNMGKVDSDCLCAFETKNREGRGRSTSTVILQDNHIILPELYKGSFSLFKTVDEYIKSVTGKK